MALKRSQILTIPVLVLASIQAFVAAAIVAPVATVFVAPVIPVAPVVPVPVGADSRNAVCTAVSPVALATDGDMSGDVTPAILAPCAIISSEGVIIVATRSDLDNCGGYPRRVPSGFSNGADWSRAPKLRS